MAQTTLLERFASQVTYQRFDPHNEEHLKAYAHWRMYGRQHPKLRFHLEDPHNNVPSMMEAKIAEAWLSQREGLIDCVKQEVAGARALSAT